MQRILFFFILSLLFYPLLAQDTQKIYLSGTGNDQTVDWEFYCTEGRRSGEWTTIPVPSCWELQGFGNYNYGHDYKREQRTLHKEEGRYKHRFLSQKSWQGQKVEIVFQGSMTDTEVKINGQLAGPTHQGAFYQFSYDISDLLNFGEENLLEVNVKKHSENASVNAAERQADFWIFGGIFRPVYLQVKPNENIDRVAIDAKANGEFMAEVFLAEAGKGRKLTAQILDQKGNPVGDPFSKEIGKNEEMIRLTSMLENPEAWSPEFPNLYQVEFSLSDGNELIHRVVEKFGFRTVELRPHDGIYINGEKIRFKGVNRHTLWPTSGRTTNKSLSIQDVKLMKEMNMNAVRCSHYPPDKHFLEACDSLGLFVIDELTGWQDAYDTEVGRKLVKELVTRDVNHPSVVIWANGNEGGNNYELVDDYSKYDPQGRMVIHPWNIFRNTDTQHYKDFNCCAGTLFHGNEVFFPTEFLHGLYDGGHGAGLDDFWTAMKSNPLSAGGFLWVFADGGIVRTDLEGEPIDSDGTHAPDGIVGPYRQKEGSFFTIKEIWAPVQLKVPELTSAWNQRIEVHNDFHYTNLNQCSATWKLLSFPDVLSDEETVTEASGEISLPDLKPQHSSELNLTLPVNWSRHDALTVSVFGPHGNELYTWTWPITTPEAKMKKIIPAFRSEKVREEDGDFWLENDHLRVQISGSSGKIISVSHDDKETGFTNGPVFHPGEKDLVSITPTENQVKVKFEGEQSVTYRLSEDGWLSIVFEYKPHGKVDYAGITFDFPQDGVEAFRWLGDGPYRVYKNRLKGSAFDVHSKYFNQGITGYQWEYPEFAGYHANLHWGELKLKDGQNLIMVTPTEGLYLYLFDPPLPPYPARARAAVPSGDLGFLHAISPIGTKFKEPQQLGPDSRPNIFQYPGGEHSHNYKGEIYLKWQ